MFLFIPYYFGSGEEVFVNGVWQDDAKMGPHVVATQPLKVLELPHSIRDLKIFLRSGTISGITKRVAEELLKTGKKHDLEHAVYHPQFPMFAPVTKIGPKTMSRIHGAWEQLLFRRRVWNSVTQVGMKRPLAPRRHVAMHAAASEMLTIVVVAVFLKQKGVWFRFVRGSSTCCIFDHLAFPEVLDGLQWRP